MVSESVPGIESEVEEDRSSQFPLKSFLDSPLTPVTSGEDSSTPGVLPKGKSDQGPDKVNWWYESIVDWMLKNPDDTLKNAAAFFNVTPTWLSLVVHSDSFRALYRARREEINALTAEDVGKKLDGLASLSLDALKDRISKHRDRLAMDDLRETAAMALKALGYGAPNSRVSVKNTQIDNRSVSITVSQSDLAEARSRMRREGAPLLESSSGRGNDNSGDGGGELSAA